MDFGDKTSRLILLAQALAEATGGFFEVKGPGGGDRATNEFMDRLNSTSKDLFGQDYSQKKICGKNNLSVDFYFPDETTVIEFAFSLHQPMNEFERDFFKCLLGIENGCAITRLVFVCKPGGQQRMEAAGPTAIRDWVSKHSSLNIVFWDLVRPETEARAEIVPTS